MNESALVIFAVFLADRQQWIFWDVVRLQVNDQKAVFAGVFDEEEGDITGELIFSFSGF